MPVRYAMAGTSIWSPSEARHWCYSNLSEALQAAPARAEIRGFLLQLATDREMIPIIARSAHVHRLGFIKLTLWASPSQDTVLRLHIWQPHRCKTVDPAIHVHNHGRDFVSNVLTGTLQNVIWQSSNDGIIFQRYAYGVFEDGVRSWHVKAGLARLQISSQIVYHAGMTYSQRSDQLHHTLVKHNQLTATLFLQGPRTNDHSYFYTAAEIVEDDSDIQFVSEADLYHILRSVAQSIQDRG